MLSQMTEHDLFKGIPSDVALYQSNKSQYLSYFFNNVLQHDHGYVKHMPLPWPLFPKHITNHDSLSFQCIHLNYDSST